MSDRLSQLDPASASSDEADVQPALSASRLVAGSLSVLLVLALAFVAGVPASSLLATVGTSAHSELGRAVAPQVVDRQTRQLTQVRPVPARSYPLLRNPGKEPGVPVRLAEAGLATGPLTLVREALLALPPPTASI